jgi:hypothetical protein
MTVTDFIQKWRNSLNYLGKPSIGIHVGWDIIPINSKVESFLGKEAWDKIYDCTPPWFKTPQTFKELITSKNADYLQIVQEEIDNGKIEYYCQNGLSEPFFCAFAKPDGSFKLLGDGNHRFLDCLYLIHEKKKDLNSDIQNTALDVIYLQNFNQVLLPDNIWRNR